ncbi:solute carrier family 2, facilitated glucose transporter member 1-like isoform X2 [Sitodiplosis mosellana]|uniref:solute carrier family 2, facilitated glucose transporter member 1-like isoform X2 n=1 Tax=Sitodiplosis mosellana TaxID=263140 RepID=UPI002445379C|nr:solute carrier family 2, facilitated glucose transporter member 1-like isoform X2 [Sitodiplosis mosellana]
MVAHEFIEEKNNAAQAPKWGLLLMVTTFAMTIGTGIPVGYNIGVMNSPSSFMKKWCNQTIIQRYDKYLSVDQLETLWSTIISIFLVGGCVGSLFAASLADRFGRKGALLTCAILFAIGAVLFGFCRALSSVEVLIVGRFIVGLSSGVTTAVLGMYLGEIAPSELRGTLGTFSGLGVTAGVVVAQVASLQELLGTDELWHYALSFYIVLVIVCFLPFKWFPESPKYLFVVAGKRDVARNELMRLRVGEGSDDLLNRINAELIAMEQEAATQADTRSIWSVLTDSTLFLPLVLICALMGGQQLSGVNAVFYYSVDIFEKVGLSEVNAKWANLGAGILNLMVAFTGPKVMEKINRRTVIIISCLLSGVFLVMLSIVMKYVDVISWFPVACVLSVFGYIIAYQFGLGPIPFFIGTELFEISTRPGAMSIGSLASWAGNFCIGMTFLPMNNAIGAFVFLPFAVVCFLLVALMYVYLPETRGREAADIAPIVSRGFRSRRF